MERHFVKASFDLDCEWEGIAPIYRIFVNDEIFVERQWLWPTDKTTNQTLQIKAPPGRYDVRVVTVGPCLANLHVTNTSVQVGPAFWADNHTLMIRHDTAD